jgi:hypothetical protein
MDSVPRGAKRSGVHEHPKERYTGAGRTNALGPLPWRRNATESAETIAQVHDRGC